MKLLYFSVFFLFPSFIYAQCCSTGSPAGASTYIGILKKQNLRITGFYRYSYFDTYYRESSPDNSFKILKNTFYNFTGTSVAFGLTHKVTIENEAGFFINKTQVYNTNPEIIRNTTGFSNGTLSLKYGFIYNEASEFELTGGI